MVPQRSQGFDCQRLDERCDEQHVIRELLIGRSLDYFIIKLIIKSLSNKPLNLEVPKKGYIIFIGKNTVGAILIEIAFSVIMQSVKYNSSFD